VLDELLLAEAPQVGAAPNFACAGRQIASEVAASKDKCVNFIWLLDFYVISAAFALRAVELFATGYDD
jgi:hypothetical protein